MKIMTSLNQSIKLITSDKVNFCLASIPIFIGMAVYYFLGMSFYEYVMGEGRAYIDSHFNQASNWGSFVYYAMAIVLTVILYFVVNWSFVIFISILSSPFNDLLSARIEKLIIGQPMEDIGTSLKKMVGKVFWTLFNELKKVFFIGSIAVIGFVLSYIPFLTPFSLIISALLLAIQFIDYSWARHDLSFGSCLSDVRRNFVGYTLMGIVFFFLVSIPLLNLIVPSFATSYFTVLWVKLNNNERTSENSSQIT